MVLVDEADGFVTVNIIIFLGVLLFEPLYI